MRRGDHLLVPWFALQRETHSYEPQNCIMGGECPGRSYGLYYYTVKQACQHQRPYRLCLPNHSSLEGRTGKTSSTSLAEKNLVSILSWLVMNVHMYTLLYPAILVIISADTQSKPVQFVSQNLTQVAISNAPSSRVRPDSLSQAGGIAPRASKNTRFIRAVLTELWEWP